MAGLVAGALSMAAGEYVSVSTQRDTERALIEKETRELAEEPEEELAELADLYRERGLSDELAQQVAARAHRARRPAGPPRGRARHRPRRADQPVAGRGRLDALLHASGALLPLLTILLFPHDLRVYVTVAAVTLALALTGYVSARIGEAPTRPAVVRNVVGGLLAMAGDLRDRLPGRHRRRTDGSAPVRFVAGRGETPISFTGRSGCVR